MARIKVVFREPVLDRYLNSPSGQVGRYMSRRGNLVVAAAKRQVGVKTGALRASIHMRHLRDTRGQFVRIGSPLPYARVHHEGSRPHIIRPNSQQVLKFVSKGQIIFAHAVKHPGTKANKYLTDNIRLMK
jgi:hypothetical protein